MNNRTLPKLFMVVGPGTMAGSYPDLLTKNIGIKTFALESAYKNI